MREEIYIGLHAFQPGFCVCSQVRRLARQLSSLYDTLLSPEDLTITQHSLLANIERAGQLSHTALAQKVGWQIKKNPNPRDYCAKMEPTYASRSH